MSDSVNDMISNISEIMMCFLNQVGFVVLPHDQITWMFDIATKTNDVTLFSTDAVLKVYGIVHVDMHQSVRGNCEE